MTSKAKPKICYVYITLPGQVEAVTAARFEWTSDRSGSPIGKLVYGRKYLARPNAVDLDPVELRLSRQLYTTALNNGVFGALRDASPDAWGRMLIDRARNSMNDEIDYLLNAQDQGAGALGFGLNETPPAPNREFNRTIELKKLQETANKIVRSQNRLSNALARQIQRLIQDGTSMMGGARPKAVVEDRTGLWIAKFNIASDPWNFARVEHSMLVLARACGITTAESKVFRIGGRDVLMIKRFDRKKKKKGYERFRMVSGLTLLRADESDRSAWSYPALVEEVRRVCIQPKENARELYRRMVFNGLISNTDDHPRNHAILASTKGWQLSPAYDLTPAVPVSEDQRDLAMVVGDIGRYANEHNMLSQCERFHYTREEAQTLIGEMKKQVQATWYNTARSQKVVLRDCDTISRAFSYPGFSYEVEVAA